MSGVKLPPVVVNVGSGPLEKCALPPLFEHWQVVRVDIDADTRPDVVASATNLSALQTATADALWCAHCIEHLYAHEVPDALREFGRVLKQSGFACIVVPDLQTVARYVAADKAHEPLYNSASGPVSPHDVMFGFGPALARGQAAMAHRCGFTPTLFLQRLQESGFSDIVLRRKRGFELMAVVRKSPFESAVARDALVAALDQ